jgi:hypothetical protein
MSIVLEEHKTTLEADPHRIKVSIIIANYNSGSYLDSCLESLQALAFRDFEVILVDNGSKDDSFDRAQAGFPDLQFVQLGHNSGYSHANNMGVDQAGGEYLVFLNPDTYVDPNWLDEMVNYLDRNPDVGIVTPKTLLMHQPDRINACGINIHLAGFPFLRGWMEPADQMNEIADVSAVVGSGFMVRSSVYERAGGFDREFFLYIEDIDLSWRTRLMGHRCVYLPDAVIYHDYQLRLTPQKFFYLERNRYQKLLKTLKWPTLLVLTPVLVLGDLVSWSYAVMSGPRFLGAKINSYVKLLIHLPQILKRRRRTQRIRVIRDHEIIQSCVPEPVYKMVGENAATHLAEQLLNPIFRLLHKVCTRIIVW